MGRCSVAVLPIVFGVIFVFIGFIMTVYGNVAKPFFSDSDSSWCDFCKEDTETTKRNIENCKIAGPIFLVLGFVLIIVGICMQKKFLNDQVLLGNQARASTSTQVINYSSMGNVQHGNIEHCTSQNAYQQSYSTQNQPQYPPQQQYPPPSQQQYPPPSQQQYPLPPQQYPPPPQQQYPPPPQYGQAPQYAQQPPNVLESYPGKHIHLFQ